MKKRILHRLLGCLAATVAVISVQAQAQHVVAFQPNEPVVTAAAANNAPSYKDYVGVYVRAKVMRAFQQSFGDATDVKWHYNNNRYLASFKENGRLCRALFDTRGMLIYTVRIGNQHNLPQDTYRQLKASYIDFAIGAVTELTAPGVRALFVNLEDKNNLVVAQVMDGQIDELHRYKTHF